jgi:predicted ATPase/DNA-binding CsgD family transcriptional regulator
VSRPGRDIAAGLAPLADQAEELTSFVGRGDELTQLKRLLAGARLVTLAGVGGVGKTRLALRFAAEARRRFPGGVYPIPLGTVDDPALVGYEVVKGLGLPTGTELSPGPHAASHLDDREALLVLDNCEHVLDAVADLVIFLLHSCPKLRIVCTSRQTLGVLGETVFPVLPLAAADDAALRLFADRAAAVVPGFALTPGNRRLVADVCARLDGLPLAIELAAAQLHSLTFEQLSAALAARLEVTAEPAFLAGHRRLRDAFDWSFELCEPAEQQLWLRLGVFVGTFDADAAVGVCATADLTELTVTEALAGLVDKSVLIREDLSGQLRYRLLETVREYALGRASGSALDLAGYRRRHAEWYQRLADAFAAGWFGPGQAEWARRMRSEQGNLRAALQWCLAAPGLAGAGQRLAASLRYFWTACGALGEGRHWLERTLAADPTPTRDRARAQSVYTRVLLTQGSLEAAAASATQALDVAATVDDPVLSAVAKFEAGSVGLLTGDLVGSRRWTEEALAGLADVDAERLTETMASTALAMVLVQTGDPHRAEALCARCRAACRRRGDIWWQAYCFQASAVTAFALGETGQARGYAQQALRLHELLGDTVGMVSAFEGIARAAVADGELVRAARLLGISVALWLSVGGDTGKPELYWRARRETREVVRDRLGSRAFDIAFGLGATMAVDAAIAYGLGVEPDRAPSRPEPREPFPLTDRECEVARLAAHGLSNRQIAARLGISQRTAESHVGNILRKLGFASRAQLAAWAARELAPLD